MLKQVVTYTDYNDVEQTEPLYFNLTRTEMMDMLDLQPRLEAWSKTTSNAQERDLETEEVRELLEIIKLLIEKSYGERSADGKHFRKSSEIYQNFAQSAAYDGFVFGLFEEPQRAVDFMTGIIPRALAEEVAKKPVETVQLPELEHTETSVPAYIREQREPTQQELQKMTPEQLQEAFRARFTAK